MIDPIEDLVSEAEITIRDAYQRGVFATQESINKIPTARKMLFDFLKFTSKYRKQVFENDSFYVLDDVMISTEELVRLFLLSYDYEQEQ